MTILLYTPPPEISIANCENPERNCIKIFTEVSALAKRSTKIALTYFVTIICALLIIGGGSYLLLNHYLNPAEDDISAVEVTTAVQGENDGYVPSALDNQTTLFILDAEDRSTATCFVLVRLLPEKCSAVVVALQSDTAASLNGISGTLYDIYRSSGASAAAHATEGILDVNVDKYVMFRKDSFEKFAALMGSITYDIPYNLIWENTETGENTIIRQGIKELDAVTMRKVLTYPNYKSGESSRISIVGTVATDLINSAQHTRVPNGMDQIFEMFAESGVETDISDFDYRNKKEAIIYIAENSEKCAELLLPTGNYSEDGKFIPDAEFISTVKAEFGSDMYDKSAEPAQ